MEGGGCMVQISWFGFGFFDIGGGRKGGRKEGRRVGSLETGV